MEKQETIIEFLLNKVAELTIENKRLNELVWSLQADCYYYNNYWQPKEKERKRKKKEEDNMPF